MLEQQKTLTLEEMALHLAVAAAVGLVIYVSYWVTHAGTIYSRKFNTSLVVLTILTATVMTVIGNNVALSLGMVGALSIVRFRTAVKDSRDAVYIFWTIVMGICCGTGDYLIAVISSAVLFVALLLLGRIKNDNRKLLIIRGAREEERNIEGIIFSYFKARANLRVLNTTADSVELIYEISDKLVKKGLKSGRSITELLYELERIEYVNLVSQSDEIGG